MTWLSARLRPFRGRTCSPPFHIQIDLAELVINPNLDPNLFKVAEPQLYEDGTGDVIFDRLLKSLAIGCYPVRPPPASVPEAAPVTYGAVGQRSKPRLPENSDPPDADPENLHLEPEWEVSPRTGRVGRSRLSQTHQAGFRRPSRSPVQAKSSPSANPPATCGPGILTIRPWKN